ncbi:autotransporter domain-containing protein [Pseudooceanicola nanhaiensis]|uniref:autotransporter domain-containing protein n=1 Tax=Pseudooceanicola nanhaiensis TaxID=375761 RepID=UPI001CD411F0|nr:autotransporter domain-containing protein [Pseudooceanicola nanhaiensis]MCA0921369.1 autotransporter outer membrane beta-barrel domain-containing protein [Pseudooceanicola nanhaiensis]
MRSDDDRAHRFPRRAALRRAALALCASLALIAPQARAQSTTTSTSLSLMEARTNSMIAQQPDLLHFLTTRRKFNLYSKVTGDDGTLRMKTGNRLPVWAEAAANWSKLDGTESESMSATLGFHMPRGEKLVYGVMMTVDHSGSDATEDDKFADGWLAGPYIIAQLTDHPLYFEGRLLYGQSRSKLTLNTGRVGYRSKRWQTRLKLSGEMPRDNVTWRPNLSFIYGATKHGAVTDSLGTGLSAQMVAIGRVTLGLDFDMPLMAQVGDLSLVGGLSGNWNSTATGETAVALPGRNDGWAKARLGFRRTLPEGTVLGGQAYVEGLGSNTYENYGLTLNLTAKF